MRVLVRNAVTRRYLTRDGKWRADIGHARVFKRAREATAYCQGQLFLPFVFLPFQVIVKSYGSIPDLVLFESPALKQPPLAPSAPTPPPTPR